MWAELVREYGETVDLIEVDRDSREGRRFAEGHGIFYQPGFVVVDAGGTVTYAGLGPFDPREVRRLVEGAAAGVP